MKQYNHSKRETSRPFWILCCNKTPERLTRLHPSFAAHALMYYWAHTELACAQQGDSRPKYLQTSQKNNFWPI